MHSLALSLSRRAHHRPGHRAELTLTNFALMVLRSGASDSETSGSLSSIGNLFCVGLSFMGILFCTGLLCTVVSVHVHATAHHDKYERIKNKRRDVAVADKPAWFVL